MSTRSSVRRRPGRTRRAALPEHAAVGPGVAAVAPDPTAAPGTNPERGAAGTAVPAGTKSAVPAHRGILEVADDIGAIFDVGSGDDELDQVRLRHRLFTVEHTRNGWFAQPVWTTDPDTHVRAASCGELSTLMAQMAAEYRLGLLARDADGWRVTP